MKQTSLFFLLTLFMVSAIGQNKFTVSGHLKHLADQEMMIMQRKNYQDVELCRTKCENGQFLLEGEIDEPDMVMLVIPRIDKSIKIYLEPADVKVNGDMIRFSDIKVTGSKTHNEYEVFSAKLKPYTNEIANITPKLKAAREARDRNAYDIAYKAYKVQQAKRDKAIMDYFDVHPNSLVASSYLAPMYFNEKDVSKLKSVFAKFGPELKGTQHYNFFKQRIADLEKTAVGNKAPELNLPTPDGSKLALSSLRGKYVLIDFWASWCGPCRSENPNVVALYNQYKDKDFEILGVSLDKKKEDWEKAIKDDKLTWKHISDVKGWKSVAAKTYSINSIPHTILVDPNGKIIAKNLRGESLKAKLKELFD